MELSDGDSRRELVVLDLEINKKIEPVGKEYELASTFDEMLENRLQTHLAETKYYFPNYHF
jgi:hypothetical protein